MRYSLYSCLMALGLAVLPASATTTTAVARRLAGDISSDAARTAETAFRLGFVQRGISPETQAMRLDNIRQRVNAMGKDLAELKALNPYNDCAISRALLQAEPLLRSIAAGTTSAIEFYNHDRNWLWTPAFTGTVASIEDRAAELHQILGDARELSVLRSRETALSRDIDLQSPR